MEVNTIDTIDRPGRKANSKKHRGVYEHPAGSNVWWMLYYNQFGKRHRAFGTVARNDGYSKPGVLNELLGLQNESKKAIRKLHNH